MYSLYIHIKLHTIKSISSFQYLVANTQFVIEGNMERAYSMYGEDKKHIQTCSQKARREETTWRTSI
jgi:hypothetical protein